MISSFAHRDLHFALSNSRSWWRATKSLEDAVCRSFADGQGCIPVGSLLSALFTADINGTEWSSPELKEFRLNFPVVTMANELLQAETGG
jgi:hypothetical protein